MYGWRGRVGMVNPSRGDTLCYEFTRMAPEGVIPVLCALGVQRMYADQLGAILDRYESAVRELAYEESDVILLGGTPPVTSGVPGTEEKLLARAQAVAPGVPVFTHVQAEMEAMEAVGVRRVAVATPYTEELGQKFAAYFRSKGVDVVAVRSLGVDRNIEIAKLPFHASYRLARDVFREAGGRVDGVHLTCPRWATVFNLDRLEQDLGVPVTSSSQAATFGALRRLAVRDEIRGFGSLFRQLTLGPAWSPASEGVRAAAAGD